MNSNRTNFDRQLCLKRYPLDTLCRLPRSFAVANRCIFLWGMTRTILGNRWSMFQWGKFEEFVGLPNRQRNQDLMQIKNVHEYGRKKNW